MRRVTEVQKLPQNELLRQYEPPLGGCLVDGDHEHDRRVFGQETAEYGALLLFAERGEAVFQLVHALARRGADEHAVFGDGRGARNIRLAERDEEGDAPLIKETDELAVLMLKADGGIDHQHRYIGYIFEISF